jgi:hypothetical protein
MIEIITENGKQFVKMPIEAFNQLVSEKTDSVALPNQTIEEEPQETDVRTLLRALMLVIAGVLYIGLDNLLLSLAVYGGYLFSEKWIVRTFGESLESMHRLYWWIMLFAALFVLVILKRAIWFG